MLKKLHLEPKNSSVSWSSCCWRPGSAFSRFSRGLMRGQWHPGLPEQLIFCSNFTFSYSGNGSLLGGKQGYKWDSAVLHSLAFCGPTNPRWQQPGLVQYHDSGAAGLEGWAKEPRDHWEKNSFEGFCSVFKKRRYFRSNEKVHCWKKNHIKPGEKKLILKSFLKSLFGYF